MATTTSRAGSGGSGGSGGLDEAAVRDLAGALRGPLLRPGDDGYDAARAVWNGAIDRRPALIARCETPPTWPRRSGSPGPTGWRSPSAAAATTTPGSRSATAG